MKAQVTSTESLECRAIGPHNVGVDGLRRGNQPGVILAHPAPGSALQERAPPGLREMQPLNGKSL